jgi:hypothetical protein
VGLFEALHPPRRDPVERAYPTRILSWHEVVNDRFGELPVLVSW